LQQEWYQLLVDECKAIITEAEFTHNWSLVEGYHQLGERILQDYPNFERSEIYGEEIVKRVSTSLGRGERMVRKSIQFAKKYPDLQLLPTGKNITVREVFNNLLPEHTEPNKLIPANGEYQVIVIDPPWPYGTEYDPKTRRVASPYPETPIEELAKFKIPAYKDSVLWLWTTHKFLSEALELMKGWGFEYKANFVWDKQRMGMGTWLRMQVEFCLLGIKGNPEWKLTNERDFLSVARKEHSRKPDEFYKMVAKLTPDTKRIDIFSREKREGFDQYGNESDKF
jgi:N6-adenosine-specific RNA methylase IME4